MYIWGTAMCVWHDSWRNDGYCGSSACEIYEWVGTYGARYRYEVRPYTHGEVVINGIDSTCDTEEVLFCWDWRGIVSMIAILLLWILCLLGLCQCVSPWGSLGEIPRAALQWSGCNSMAPASGCPWWCPICITR